MDSKAYNLIKIGLVFAIFLPIIYLYIEYSKTPDLSELEKKRALWESTKPVNYSYNVYPSCFCLDTNPYKATLLDGTVYASPIEGLDDGYYETYVRPTEPLSIDDLFQMVEDASINASTIDVEYDTQFGHPERIFIDWVRNTIDDEYSVSVDTLKPL